MRRRWTTEKVKDKSILYTGLNVLHLALFVPGMRDGQHFHFCKGNDDGILCGGPTCIIHDSCGELHRLVIESQGRHVYSSRELWCFCQLTFFSTPENWGRCEDLGSQRCSG